MEAVHKLERTMAGWYKQLPHLPANGQTWLARNVWWIVLIGVILGGLGILSVLGGALFVSAALIGLGGIVGAAASGAVLLALVVSVAFSLADVVVLAIAIPQLKAMRSRGWMLLYIAVLINIAALIVSFLVNWNFGALVVGALGTAVGLYFAFEIRSHFAAVDAPKRTPAANPAK